MVSRFVQCTKVPDQGTGKGYLFIHSQDPASNWPLQRGTFKKKFYLSIVDLFIFFFFAK